MADFDIEIYIYVDNEPVKRQLYLNSVLRALVKLRGS